MNTIDAIYTRHQRSLMAVDQASDVVLFSLRLALEELAASAAPDRPANLSQAERDRDMLAAEIHNLQAWLDSSFQYPLCRIVVCLRPIANRISPMFLTSYAVCAAPAPPVTGSIVTNPFIFPPQSAPCSQLHFCTNPAPVCESGKARSPTGSTTRQHPNTAGRLSSRHCPAEVCDGQRLQPV